MNVTKKNNHNKKDSNNDTFVMIARRGESVAEIAGDPELIS